MRDPARIPRILGKLRAYWLTHADLRLGQIVSNAARDLTPGGAGPAFYMEDDDLDAWLTGDEPAQRADQHDKAGPDWQTERAKADRLMGDMAEGLGLIPGYPGRGWALPFVKLLILITEELWGPGEVKVNDG